ncbi:hypothetical protein [Croceivirga radicis]|uniref:hypothetical protein n=1 Tax=Croceivirga radicis TaxID=1929488 RepID=UPI000255B867|nr:hypothetical protein [Croceivirga radicis]
MKTPVLFENSDFYEKEKYFSQFGSVLNLVQFFFSELPENNYDFSAFVAKEALKSLKKRKAKFYEKPHKQYQSQYYFNSGLNGAEISYDIEGVEPKGKKIELGTFLGESYSKKFKELTHRANSGLSYALLEPPYSLRYTEFIRQQARELGRKKLNNWERIKLVQTKFFNYFLEEIELDVTDENQLVIYEWDNNWSYYFDAGKEWWGTFFWTVLNSDEGIITVISASTTD